MSQIEPMMSKEDYDQLVERIIVENKERRVALDGLLQQLKYSERQSRERSLAITKLEEAIMWLGMDLKTIGQPNPYPNSYKPENLKVDPITDGLKL